MEKSMLEKGYDLGNMVLSCYEMAAIHKYYKVGCTQEFIYDNYKLSLQDAERIAYLARELQEDADDSEPLSEMDAILTAAGKLGITLICKN